MKLSLKSQIFEKRNKLQKKEMQEKSNKIKQKLFSLKEFKPKTFGILEPKESYQREFNPDKLDIVIVPGIAFDKNGHRIGYGYGYYDRFLKTIRKETLKIGLAYDFQLIEKIPEERHDVPVDIILTEKEIAICNKNQH